MINLLPEETKKHLKAAHTNYILIRYVIFIGLSLAFLAGASYVTYTSLNDTLNNPSSSSSVSGNSQVSNQANAINANLLKAKNILEKQISYSKVITELVSTLPSGVVLDSPITINNNSINNPIALKAHIKSSTGEDLLKQHFEGLAIFTNYSAQESVANNSSNAKTYPTSISFSVTVNKELAK